MKGMSRQNPVLIAVSDLISLKRSRWLLQVEGHDFEVKS